MAHHPSLRLLCRILGIAAGLFVIFVFIAHFKTPKVTASNIAQHQGKIASNAPLQVKFSQMMNRKSVEKNFEIFPELRGRFDWSLATLTFYPEERFAIGEQYTLTIKGVSENVLGQELGNDLVLSFDVVDPPHIALALPNGPTQADSRVTVMFDRPMIELTTLDTSDARALPFEIAPKIEGKVKWIGTSAVQIIPKERLAYSTEYKGVVVKGTKSLDGGALEQEFQFSFQTPLIEPLLPLIQSANAIEPYTVRFNQPINLKSLEEHLRIMRDGKEVAVKLAYGILTEYELDKDGKQIEKKVENKSVVEIAPKEAEWGYGNFYELTLAKGYAGVEGNLTGTKAIEGFSFSTNQFLLNFMPDKTQYRRRNRPLGGGEEEIGTLTNFTLSFDDDVDPEEVVKHLIVDPKAEFVAKFGKKCDPKWEPEESPDEKCPEVDDHKVVVLTPTKPLAFTTKYTLGLKKSFPAANGKLYLKDDLTYPFLTGKPLSILRATPQRGELGSYKQVCLYTTNLFDIQDIEKKISFEPKAKAPITALAYSATELGGSETSYEPDPSRIQNCGGGSNDEFVLDIRTLLDPETSYTMTVAADAADRLGHSLGTPFSHRFKTRSLEDIDTSLEILQRNFYATATVEQHAATLVASRNLDAFDVEVCKLSAKRVIEIDSEFARAGQKNSYARYDKFGWSVFTPSEQTCDSYIKKTQTVKREYWKRQFTELTLKDVLGAQPSAGNYFLQISSPRVFRQEPFYTYSEKFKYDVFSGYRKVPLRPSQLLTLTNTHAAVKSSSQQALAWVTDLSTGKPVGGATLTRFSLAGDAQGAMPQTNGDGISKLKTSGIESAYLLVERGADELVVRGDWSAGISPWDFRFNYSQSQRFTQSYVYTERPLYQPTHQVFFKGIVRRDNDARLELPDFTKVSVDVFDSRNTKIYEKQLTVSPFGTFADSVTLDKSAPLGLYIVDSCMKKHETQNYCIDGFYSTFFSVEEYRKPELEVKVSTSKESYINKETLTATIDGQYFFGAPVKNQQLSWTLLAQNYYFDEYESEDGGWFSFSDSNTYRNCYWGCPYGDEVVAEGTGMLDRSGKFILTHPLVLTTKDNEGKVKPADTSKIYTLVATIVDKNNQSVSGRKEFMVHRGEYYVGIRTDAYIAQAGKKIPITVLSVAPDGTPVSGKSIDVAIYKQEWKYVKKKNVDGGFYWENERKETLVKKRELSTDDKGLASHEFPVQDGGEYIARATGKDALSNEFSSSVDFYVTSEEVVHWKQENNNRIEVKADKQSYNIGDTARLLVQSPYADVKALVTHERGDIEHAEVVDVTANTYVLQVPITEKMLPNIYVGILAVKGGDAKTPPDFKVGYANLVVDVERKTLDVSMKTDKDTYAPREKVTLEVTTADFEGKPVAADLSIAVVDKSLLALKGNPARNLVNHFYNRKFLGVLTADSLTVLLERIDVANLSGAKGGSGKGFDESKVRGKFEDTAFWRSSVATNSDGKATVSFTLPDNLTTWNIEVIGHTTRSLFGDKNITVTTQKPIIVRPVLPRFARYKDELKLAAIVHNFTPNKQTFDVSIKTKHLIVASSANQKVSVPAQGSKKVYWDVEVPHVPEGTLAEITMSATAGKEHDAVLQKFPIQTYSTPESVALSSFTDDVSFTEKLLLPESVDKELGELKITTGATLATYVSDSLNYLLGFPYGCSEQVMSQLVPSVVLKNAFATVDLAEKLKLKPLYDEHGKEISFDIALSNGLQKLYAAQRPDGGWGYWSESRESYPYLTAYIIYGLDQVQKAGYSVDQNVVTRARNYILDYLKNNRDLLDRWTGKLLPKNSAWANSRAYLLFVLSETGRGDIGLTKSLYEDRNLLATSGKIYLAMTLHAASPETSIAELLKDVENQARIEPRGTYIRSAIGSSFDMMTDTKVTSLALQMFTRVNKDHPLTPKLIQWLIKSRVDGHWATTQDTVTALIALTEYLKKSGELAPNYTAKIAVNDKVVKEYAAVPKGIFDQQFTQISMRDIVIGAAGNEINFSKDGKGRLYYDLVLRYFLPVAEIKPRSEGFAIERAYYRLDDTKFEHPVIEVKAGETLKGRLTIAVPDQRSLVAVENFLPAGFELVNFEFENVDTSLSVQKFDEFSEAARLPSLPRPFFVSDVAMRDTKLPIHSESIASASAGYYWGYTSWTRRELRNDRLFLFAERLSPGIYEYDYFVNVTSEGEFRHPPAVVSEMYYPENFGRTAGEVMRASASAE